MARPSPALPWDDFLPVVSEPADCQKGLKMSAIREWGGRFVILVPEVQIYD